MSDSGAGFQAPGQAWLRLRPQVAPEDLGMAGRLRRSRTAIAFLSIVCFSTTWFSPGTAEAQPPLHQVADHWTAWDPPETVPEGSEVYTIQSGDTLWALAGRILGDPYRWPELWESNQYILDAEWIYPGDPLIVPSTQIGQADGIAGPSITELPEPGMPSEEDPYETEPAQDDSSRFSVAPQVSAEKPVPLGYESDLYCTGFIGDLEEDHIYTVSGSEYEFMHPSLEISDRIVEGIFGKSDTVKYILSVGDIVYISGGRADGLSAGTVLVAIQPEDEVRHPRTKNLVGRFYNYTARVRVLAVQENTAIGEVSYSCDPMSIGAILREFEPEPVPLRRMSPMRPANFPSSIEEVEAGPTIVLSRDRVISIGIGHMLWVDNPPDVDMVPGDIFTIYRRGREGFPPIVVGESAVLSVTDHGALMRVLRSRHPIYLGDSMVLK